MSKNVNVTYLLGAGASAFSMPTVKPINKLNRGLSQELHAMAVQLEEEKVPLDLQVFHSNLIKNLKWLSTKSDEFETLDTYAKFLYIKGQSEDLRNLKEALSIFFIIHQVINKKLDKRYLTFLTTITQHNRLFPETVNILTWNYDFQMQIAAEYFKTETFSESYGASVHSPPFIGYYPSIGYTGRASSNEFNLIHLNGIAGCYYDSPKQQNNNLFIGRDNLNTEEIYRHFSKDAQNKHHLITFAWENGGVANLMKEKLRIAQEMASNTDILVVIGYSFPFFNREIDKSIFDVLKKSVSKIYFQDPYRDGEFLRNQFNLNESENKRIEIQNIKDGRNFYVPFEM